MVISFIKEFVIEGLESLEGGGVGSVLFILQMVNIPKWVKRERVFLKSVKVKGHVKDCDSKFKVGRG